MEELPIKYLEYNDTIKKYPEFKALKNEIFKKFFIPKKYQDKLIIYYLDVDDDQYPIENDENYSENFSEIKGFSLELEEKVGGIGNIEDIKKSVSEVNEKLNKDIKEYEKKLHKSCINIIKKEMEELNEKHKKQLNQLKNYYEKKINKIKEEQSVSKLKEIDQKAKEFIDKKIEDYLTSIHKDIEELVINKKESWIKKINEIEKDFDSFEQKQNEIEKTIDDSKKNLDNVIKK